MADLLSLICVALAASVLSLVGAGLLLRHFNIRLVTYEPGRAETVVPTFRSSAPPPTPPMNLASVATVTPGGALARVPRTRPVSPKQLDGVLVRLLIDFRGERISIPLVFDESATTETLHRAAQTLGAGTAEDQEEMLEEIYAAVVARGTPPTRVSAELFGRLRSGVVLFGAAGHLRGDVHIPIMARVVGELGCGVGGEVMFSARKGLSPTGLLVEYLTQDGTPVGNPLSFSASTAPIKIPDQGILVRQVVGLAKERGFAPIPSALAWEIVPHYS